MTRRLAALAASAMLGACGDDLRPSGVPECAEAGSSAPIGAPTATASLLDATVVDGKVRVPLTVSVTIACLKGFVRAQLTTSAGGFVGEDATAAPTAAVLLAPRVPEEPSQLFGAATLELAPGQTAWVLAEVGEQIGAACVAVPAGSTAPVRCSADPAAGAAP